VKPLLSWKLFVVVFVLAGVLRLWGAFDYNIMVRDETFYVPRALHLVQYGSNGNRNWFHPQLNDIILAASIKVFGNNSVGWRMYSILFGTASIFMLYLVAKQLYPESTVPLLSASLLAFDPFHIFFSRTAMTEPPAISFFLLFLYLMLQYCEKNRQTLVLAGIAMGLAIATKAYFVFAIPVVVIYAYFRTTQRNNESKSALLARFAVTLVLLPIGVYLISYFYWFGRGHTLLEFYQFRSDAFLIAQNFQYENKELMAMGGKPWEWFLKPFAAGYELFSDGTAGRFMIEINNPLFRIPVLPAMCIVAVYAVKKRNVHWLLAPVLFSACYLLLLVVQRPIASYSAYVLLPFAYLALAHAVSIVANVFKREKEVVAISLIMIVISGCYLYPLATGFLVPTALYEPILPFVHLIRVF